MFDLASELNDKTTTYYKMFNKPHPWFNHLMCVILRIVIGLIILNMDTITDNMILTYSTIVIMIFLSKFLFATPTWKVYIRTVILYAIILVNYKNKNLKQIASSMIILDAVMGLQSRFIQSNISSLL